MPKWTAPTESLPGDIQVGDRIVIIVNERPFADAPLRPRLVILEATEEGWDSPDSLYEGYSPSDGLLWATEKNVCEVVSACLGIQYE